MFEAEFWARWLGIVLIDLSLAGDNALVIAMAVRSLPRRQQMMGRLWGTVGAVALRIAFIGIITFLFRVPFLQFAGGLILLYIALKLVRQEGGSEEHVREGTTLRGAIGIIILADVVMSLDNVLGVAAAAHGDMRLVVFGIALSLPLVVWGSGILARLMTRYQWIVWIGGGVLGYVAGELLVKDPAIGRLIGEIAHAVHYPLPIALAIVMTALGWWFARRHPAERIHA
jgi:YjbE family integral membrane protein